MYGLAEKIYYGLLALVLASVLFVVQQSDNKDVSLFQSQVKNEFKIAAVQVLGDQSVFESFQIVISGVNQFYEDAATEMIAMLQPAPSEQDMNTMLSEVYKKLIVAFNPKTYHDQLAQVQPKVLGAETREQSPVVAAPEIHASHEMVGPIPPPIPLDFKKITTTASVPAIETDDRVWVDLNDGVTGQTYCVAIFNAEVNRYLGSCKHDYY
jgi:hypothetical protein